MSLDCTNYALFLLIINKWQESQMACALDSDGELALLLGGKTGLAHGLNVAIAINVVLQSLYVAIIKVKIGISF